MIVFLVHSLLMDTTSVLPVPAHSLHPWCLHRSSIGPHLPSRHHHTPHSQVCLQVYQVSPKMAELSPSSYAFPNCQSSHNPTSSAYGFNPASHIQVSNSPGHPLAQTKNVCNEMYTEVLSMSTGNLGMSVPLQHVPFHPPPDYTEATSLNGTHFMPCSYPLAIASEYPDHHMPALPGAGHPHGTQFHQ